VKPDDGGENIFFHVKSFTARVEPSVNDRVEFDLGTDPKSGRSRAENLRLI
jgi:CspA family cold shock protein